jgi:hypothetical protein
MFTINYDFKDGAYAEITGSSIKYWDGFGLPDYEGGLEGFETMYPLQLAELLKKKIIRKS